MDDDDDHLHVLLPVSADQDEGVGQGGGGGHDDDVPQEIRGCDLYKDVIHPFARFSQLSPIFLPVSSISCPNNLNIYPLSLSHRLEICQTCS